MTRRYFVFICVISVLMLANIGLSYASDISKIKKQIKSETAQKKKLDIQTKVIETEISKIKKNLIKTSDIIKRNKKSLSNIDNNLSELQIKKDNYKKTLMDNSQDISKLIIAKNRIELTPPQALLLQNKSTIDIARSDILLKYTIPNINNQTSELKENLNELNNIEISIKNVLDKQRRVYNQLDKKEKELENLLTARRKNYKKKLYQKKSKDKELAKLVKKAKSLEELMVSIQKIPTKKTSKAPKKIKANKSPKQLARFNKGKFQAPVHGKIKAKFGQKDSSGLKSKGITYLVNTKERVYLPFDGTVRFAGPFQKYKQIIIVEHSNGYHSLIAGLGRLDIRVGDDISAGEPIGLVDSNRQASNKLYYELRHKGKAVNPMPVTISKKQRG